MIDPALPLSFRPVQEGRPQNEDRESGHPACDGHVQARRPLIRIVPAGQSKNKKNKSNTDQNRADNRPQEGGVFKAATFPSFAACAGGGPS